MKTRKNEKKGQPILYGAVPLLIRCNRVYLDKFEMVSLDQIPRAILKRSIDDRSSVYLGQKALPSGPKPICRLASARVVGAGPSPARISGLILASEKPLIKSRPFSPFRVFSVLPSIEITKVSLPIPPVSDHHQPRHLAGHQCQYCHIA